MDLTEEGFPEMESNVNTGLEQPRNIDWALDRPAAVDIIDCQSLAQTGDCYLHNVGILVTHNIAGK